MTIIELNTQDNNTNNTQKKEIEINNTNQQVQQEKMINQNQENKQIDDNQIQQKENDGNEDQIQIEENVELINVEQEVKQENEIDLKEENVEVKDEEEQEDVEQKERDQKIKKRLNEINEDYVRIIEKVEIHQNIIQQISQCEESKQIESTQQLKFSKKSFLENQIKLEKLLLSIDSLVGASSKLRPQKKEVVNQIQKAITQIDQLLEQLKTIENKVELLQKQQKEKREQEKREQEEEKKNEEKNTQQKEKEIQQQSRVEQKIESSPLEIIRQIMKIKENQKNQKEVSPVKDEPKVIPLRNIIVQSDEKENEFPFPSKEKWEMLRFEPKFNFEQHQNRLVLSSFVPSLNIEDIKISTSRNILTIEGVKYPNEQEKQVLIKRLIQSVDSYILNRLTSNQIISAILKIASQYNFGKFSVKYELPSNFDSSQNIDATYKNGILQIELPIRNKNRQNFLSDPYFRREVPFYGYQQTRRSPNNFWDFY